jgi:hypothetical protein
MLAKTSERLDRWASGWLILGLIAVLVAFEAITLPILQRSPGGNIEPLDGRFFYTPQEAFSTIGSYADAAPFWIRVYLTWDIVNPFLYTLIIALLMSWLFQRGFAPESRIQLLNVLPIGAGIFDLLENALIVTMLATYPARPAPVAWLSTVCTMSKVSILAVCILLVLFGTVKAVTHRLRTQRL